MATQPKARWMVAQDTITGDLESGAGFTVLKGQHLLSTHEVVKLDQGRNFLFKPAEDEPEPAAEPPAAPRRGAGKGAS